MLFPSTEENKQNPRKRRADSPCIDLYSRAEKSEEKYSLNLIKTVLEESIRPLRMEILNQKEEIKSLKALIEKTSQTPEMVSNPLPKIREKAPSMQQIEPKKAVEKMQTTAQKTAKKTFAEIAKLNSLVTEQSIKLDT